MTEEEFKKNEMITVKMTRQDYMTMEKIVKERQAYDVITGKFRTWWIWALAGSILTVVSLWDAVKLKFGGV